jgi:hypothetical protein
MALAGGVVLGIVYTLSPLTIWAAAIFAFLIWKIGDGLPETERKRVRAILVVAIVTRAVAIGGVWLTTDHTRVPFAAFFGDEGYYIRRAMWLRNIGLGIPIHNADMIYAFDEYSYMPYMYFIAFVEALVGFAPYGLKILSAAMYVSGAVVLFRLARSAYGSGVALAGLLVVLFLPSLFAWSIAVLKEPPYFLIGALACAAAAATMQTSSNLRRVAGVIFLCAAAVGLQSIREGSAIIAVIGLGGGMLLGWLAHRPRAALVCAVAAPIAVTAALSRPPIQLKAVRAIRAAATLHWWQVNTPGYSYQTLDPPSYSDKESIDGMTRGETGRFLVRSAVDYVVVPSPWTIESRAALAFVPELMFWYAMLALLPVGLIAALRRDAGVTMVLACYAFALAAPVALSDGNVGTLIRHRGLALPFLIWLSAAGGEALLVFAARTSRKALAWP